MEKESRIAIQKMIELVKESIARDSELLTLLKRHDREMAAISARRGLSLLIGRTGSPCANDALDGGKGSVQSIVI